MGLLHNRSCSHSFPRRSIICSVLLAPLASLLGVRSALAEDKAEPPVLGGPLSTRSHVLDTAADALQVKRPVDAMSEFLNGFHFYADDMGRQVEANHYCTHLTEDFHQCVIYSSNTSEGKLIGIEYIVSEKLFKTLPDEEKRLWHSHHYEVSSGELVAPTIPEVAEHAFMKDLITTYGKTWHTWQIDRDQNFPMGIPQLMMGFVKDGQVNISRIKDRDKRFDIDSDKRKIARSDIPMPTVVSGANAWQNGKTVQLVLQEVDVKNLRS